MNPLLVRAAIGLLRHAPGGPRSRVAPAGTRTLSAPTRHGAAPVTVYPGGDGSPVHVNLHGGGYVLPGRHQDQEWCRTLAATGVTVLDVEYVLAPEHPFPAAVEQTLDVLAWAAAPETAHGGDGGRLTVGGQSAGGGLAAAAARHVLATGRGPRIALQVLHYPPLDLASEPGTKRARTAKPLIGPRISRLFNAAYLPVSEAARNPLASPAAPGDDADLTGITPAVVVTAELDTLRDEAVRYANRLRAAGALVEHIDVPGADHAYDLRGGPPGVVADVRARLAAHIRGAHQGA